MSVRLLKARAFEQTDSAGKHVSILNLRLAKLVFGSRDPLGQHIAFGPPPAPWSEIVGTVADMRQDALEREPAPELFVQYTQQPTFAMAFILRADSNP